MNDSANASGSLIRTDRASATVLLIENDPLLLTAMGSVMNMQGYRAVLARTEAIAMESISAGQFDVIVLSIDALQSGCDFAARLRSSESSRDVPIIFLVPELSASWSSQLSAHGGIFSMLKPIEPYGLIELVDKALWMPHVVKGRLGKTGNQVSSQRDWISLS